jgi:ABC-2 type transport system permease protein
MTGPVARPGPIRIRYFARLKLRVIGNGLRGHAWRVVLFLVGALFGLWFAAGGFFVLAAPGLAGNADLAVVVPAFAGALLVLAWLLLPLVFFGVDETLDPARFALLPLPRRTLAAGLLTAALLGVPAVAVLGASGGLVLGAAARGGWPAALAQAAGVLAGLLLCVAASRAVTSAFATMLRSRRVRDLAAVLLALLAALIGPLQVAVLAAVERADYHRLVGPARVLGWTPLAAPYTVGTDVVEGHAWAVPAKLAITAATVAALLWWWSASLESAMVGAAASGGRWARARADTATRPDREASGGAPAHAAGRNAPQPALSAQLFPRLLPWLPSNPYGAIAARETRYWWRDTRRRANLITIAVVGVFVPVMVNLGNSRLAGEEHHATPTSMTISMLFIGVYGAVLLANQFGFDGTAYAAHLVAAVPGRTELRARLVAASAYLVPVLILIGLLVAAFVGEPTWLPTMLGGIFAAYGTGLAVNLFVSVLGAYAVPESTNPFAVNAGRGMTKSLLAFVAMLATMAIASPFLIAAVWLGDAAVWVWLALPVGLGYGLGAVALGLYIVGDLLDRRGPELLLAVSPRR